MHTEVSKIDESCEEVCHADTKFMPLQVQRNINRQRCDMRKVWYPTFYQVLGLLGILITVKKHKQCELKDSVSRSLRIIQHVEHIHISYRCIRKEHTIYFYFI